MTQQEFHERISSHFEGPKEDQNAFLGMCRYLSGQYDEEASFRELNAQVSKWEFERNRQHRHRIFYLALPPNVFVPVSGHLRMFCYSEGNVNRIVIEKPFGRDVDSCREMLTLSLIHI